MERVTFINSDDVKEKADTIFSEQRNRILKILPMSEVHHVGGTAVPDSLTKGDIDINVRVKSNEFTGAVEKLKDLYAVAQPNNWTDAFASFKDDDSFKLPLGVQLTIIDSPLDHFVKRTKILTQNSKLSREYDDLKRKYEGKDMGDYRAAKHSFLETLDR